MAETIPILIQSDKHTILRPQHYISRVINGVCYICGQGTLIQQDQISDTTRILHDHLVLLSKIKEILGVWINWKVFENTGVIKHKRNNGDAAAYTSIMEQCAQAIIPFYEKWGCYGIMWRKMAAHSISMKKQINGGIVVESNDPISVTVMENNFFGMWGFSDGLPHGSMAYEDYQQYFFPTRNKDDLPNQEEAQEGFFSNYCEPVPAIIFNKDVYGTILHIEMQKRNSLFGKDVSPTEYDVTSPEIVASKDGGSWHLIWRYSSLLQALSILYVNNLIGAQLSEYGHHISICQNPSCSVVFECINTSHKVYCSETCANAARQRRKRINKRIAKEASNNASKDETR